jgi:hypothetical protein
MMVNYHGSRPMGLKEEGSAVFYTQDQTSGKSSAVVIVPCAREMEMCPSKEREREQFL